MDAAIRPQVRSVSHAGALIPASVAIGFQRGAPQPRGRNSPGLDESRAAGGRISLRRRLSGSIIAMNTITACPPFWFLNNHVTIGVSQAETSDGVSVLRFLLPFGEAPPLHVHRSEDEIFHLIRGEMRFCIGPDTIVAQPGRTVLAPRGIAHGFRVISEGGAECLIITHGSFEKMVREMARPADGDAAPEPVALPPAEQARLTEVCKSAGIDLIGPPID
jgi:quercetin dioxygenase-like cupin family protein